MKSVYLTLKRFLIIAGYADFSVTGCEQIKTPNIDRLAHYFGGTLPKEAHLTKGDRGSKFERPQILKIDGKPFWLYGPSGTNTYG